MVGSAGGEPLVPDVGSTVPRSDDLPHVPGYELLGVLGAGASGRVWRGRRTGPDVESTTRDCPECLSAIPIAAHRCAFCTSEVAPA